MNKEDNLKAIEHQLLSQNLMNIKNQIQSITLQSEELKKLKEDMLGLKEINQEKTFVPLGGGIFVEGEIKQPKDVLMNVGSNILVRKDFSSAETIIEKQVKELENISTQMQEEVKKIEERLISMH